MMKPLRIKYWITGVFLTFLACDMKQEVEIEVPPHEQELIVECYLEPGEAYRALVTHTTSFYEKASLSATDTAEISIHSTDANRSLYPINSADTNFNKVFNYWHPEKVKYEEGKEYQISIKVNGQVKATGKTRFLPKVKVEETRFKQETDSTYAAFVRFKDNPDEDNYYRLILRGSNPDDGYTYNGLWDDSDAKDGYITAYTPYILEPGWTVVVNLYHIDKQYYDFLKSVKHARDANYNPFMQPASIRSTLEGATGVFTAVSLTSDTVLVE